MTILRRAGLAGAAVWLWLGSLGLGAEPKPDATTTRLTAAAPCPALAAAAAAMRIPLNGFTTFAGGASLAPGDSVVAMVTLFESDRPTDQWLVQLRASPTNTAGLSSAPSAPLRIYTSMGENFEFVARPAPATVRTLGPFRFKRSASTENTERTGEISLDQGYLSLGLDAAAGLVWRKHREGGKKGPLMSGTVPFSETQVAEGKALAAALNIGREELRALAGTYPALLSYFNTIQQTPGVREILLRVLERPSIWSLLRHGGVRSVDFSWSAKGLEPVEPSLLGLPAGSPAFRVPMTLRLNGQPAVEMTLMVTTPRPPLLACAGIVGVVAEKPNAKGRYLTLRVIAAQRDEGPR